jgi:nicotinamidase/pyrazinamidase
MKNGTIAFGLIDAQRGFMPAAEGERLALPGFGELGVTNGELIIPNVNTLLGEFATRDLITFTTQDWHPLETAHYARDGEEPNFDTTWPVHCVAGTPGAELHPDIVVPDTARRFIKGTDVLLRGEDDTSYSGYNGYDPDTGQMLGEFLQERGVTTVLLGGLALDYCVKATALDLKQRTKLEVAVVTDVTKPVATETGESALVELQAAGVILATTEEMVRYIRVAA